MRLHVRCGCSSSCARCASWWPSSDFASRTRPRGFSAAAAAATPAAFPITSPHELPVGSTSDVAAPAGAETSRPYLVLHAVPIRVRLLLSLPLLRPLRLLVAELRLRFAYLASWSFRGCSRGHTCSVSDPLAARTSRVLHLRCGCAGRRGNFTPSLPVEALPRSLPPAPFWASASRNLVTMRHCPGTAGGIFRSIGVGTDVLHDRAGRLNRDAQDAGSPLLHATLVAVFV